jgi:imidazolonepropionase-like amidohydrolase
VIRDASVLDTRTGRVVPHRTVVVHRGRITAVVPAGRAGGAGVPRAARVLEARGRLLTPGLVDVHGHSADVLADTVNETGNTEARRLSMAPDSITAYRLRFARAYLPYGVTTVREAGGDDRYMALMRAWMRPAPWAPDFYPSGGALVSPDPARPTPYAGHRVVADSATPCAPSGRITPPDSGT